MAYEYDWEGAREALGRSIEMNPGLWRTHYYYSHYHLAMGRPDKAIASLEQALALDPLSTMINGMLGMAHLMNRQYDEATEWLQKALEITPNAATGIGNLGVAYAKKGEYEEAISIICAPIRGSLGY